MTVLYTCSSRTILRAAQKRGGHHLGQHLFRLPATAETSLHELLLPPRGGWYQSFTDPCIQVQSWDPGPLLPNSNIYKSFLHRSRNVKKSAVKKVNKINLKFIWKRHKCQGYGAVYIQVWKVYSESKQHGQSCVLEEKNNYWCAYCLNN